MRYLLFLVLIVPCTFSIAQTQKRSNKEKDVFPYSYQLNARDFVKPELLYTVAVYEWNSDTLIVNCECDSTKASGTISYEYNLMSGITYTDDNNFQLKIPKSELENTLMNLTVQFDGYIETLIHIDLNEQGVFIVPIEAYSIFDEESPFIIVKSAHPMSESDLNELVNCLSLRRSEKQLCYDENLIHLVVPI